MKFLIIQAGCTSLVQNQVLMELPIQIMGLNHGLIRINAGLASYFTQGIARIPIPNG